MDKNEEFRRRLEKKKKDLLKQDRSIPVQRPLSVQTDAFDPTPYTNIILDRFGEQKISENDDPMLFLTDLPKNPEFDFIFGKSSVLNVGQKAKIVHELMQRLMIAKEFDPEPYAQELVDMWGTPAFNVYEKDKENGKKDIDLTAYYAKYNWTKEQKLLVFERFLDLQSDEVKKNQKKIMVPFFISAAVVIISPFFIPNALQSLGWLPHDTGWFLKIIIVSGSGIVLYFIVKNLFILTSPLFLRKKQVV